MKRLILLVSAIWISAMLFATDLTNTATCTGSKNCKACKNCKYCKHCAKDKGTCSVCE